MVKVAVVFDNIRMNVCTSLSCNWDFCRNANISRWLHQNWDLYYDHSIFTQWWLLEPVHTIHPHIITTIPSYFCFIYSY